MFLFILIQTSLLLSSADLWTHGSRTTESNSHFSPSHRKDTPLGPIRISWKTKSTAGVPVLHSGCKSASHSQGGQEAAVCTILFALLLLGEHSSVLSMLCGLHRLPPPCSACLQPSLSVARCFPAVTSLCESFPH